MVVYGDLLFLINFSMDFLCFYISCLLLHKKMPTVRVCLSACLGGVYSVASLFISVGKTEAVIIDMSVLLLMCCTVYLDKNESPWEILRELFSISLFLRFWVGL